MKQVQLNVEFNIEDEIADKINLDISNGSFTYKLSTLLTQAYSGGHVVMPEELESIIADLLDDEYIEDDDEEMTEKYAGLFEVAIEKALSKLVGAESVKESIIKNTSKSESESQVYADVIKQHESNIIKFSTSEISDVSDENDGSEEIMSDDEADELADIFGF